MKSNLAKVFVDVVDEVAAFIIILVGLYYAVGIDFQNGITLIGIGSSYLFGKSVPRNPK